MKWIDRVGRRVKLRDLHIALAVAEAGSMSKAAAQLAVSYPVVSKTISALERTLGVPLFERGISGVQPTPYGQALLNCGVAVFDEMRQGLKRIEFIKEPDAGELQIGSSELMDAGLLSAIIERFSQKYPRAVLRVTHSNIVALQYADLRNRDVELVLGRIRAPFVEEDLAAETLFHELMVVVTGTINRWARRRRVELAELIEEPWVLAQPGSLPRSLQEEAFHSSGLEVPRANVLLVSLQLYAMLLATGRWIGIIPGSIMRFGAKGMSLKILPIKISSPPRPVGFITLKKHTLSPLAARFIDCAHAVAKASKIA